MNSSSFSRKLSLLLPLQLRSDTDYLLNVSGVSFCTYHSISKFRYCIHWPFRTFVINGPVKVLLTIDHYSQVFQLTLQCKVLRHRPPFARPPLSCFPTIPFVCGVLSTVWLRSSNNSLVPKSTSATFTSVSPFTDRDMSSAKPTIFDFMDNCHVKTPSFWIFHNFWKLLASRHFCSASLNRSGYARLCLFNDCFYFLTVRN